MRCDIVDRYLEVQTNKHAPSMLWKEHIHKNDRIHLERFSGMNREGGSASFDESNGLSFMVLMVNKI